MWGIQSSQRIVRGIQSGEGWFPPEMGIMVMGSQYIILLVPLLSIDFCLFICSVFMVQFRGRVTPTRLFGVVVPRQYRTTLAGK
jgi:hypothetical protein